MGLCYAPFPTQYCKKTKHTTHKTKGAWRLAPESIPDSSPGGGGGRGPTETAQRARHPATQAVGADEAPRKAAQREAGWQLIEVHF